MRTYAKVIVFALAVLVGPAVSKAYAVSIRDLIELSKEGVSDAVLIALIETDGSRFRMTPDDIRSVRAQGLSDLVIVAMIRTRPSSAPPRDGAVETIGGLEAPAPVERVVERVVERASPPVVVQQTVVQKVTVERPRRDPDPVYVPVYVPVAVRPVEEKKKEEPVYWGWGGQRRPDAWKEPVIIK